MYSAIIRPRRSRSAAAYSRQTFPWTICRSVCRSVRASVGLSSALWKNGGSDPDAVWHHRSDEPGMRQVIEFGDLSTGRVLLGANLRRAIVTSGDFMAYVCDGAATRPSSQITLGRLVKTPGRLSSMTWPNPSTDLNKLRVVLWCDIQTFSVGQ